MESGSAARTTEPTPSRHMNPRKIALAFVLVCLPLLAACGTPEQSSGPIAPGNDPNFTIVAHTDDGTLFLDEIGDLSPQTQGRLLRAIETGEYQRVGETSPRQCAAGMTPPIISQEPAI